MLIYTNVLCSVYCAPQQHDWTISEAATASTSSSVTSLYFAKKCKEGLILPGICS